MRWVRWVDDSGLLAHRKPIKKHGFFTGLATLFMNGWIFTRDRFREPVTWHSTSCQFLSFIFVSYQIAIRTLLSVNLLCLICWKIWTLKSCQSGRKCFCTSQECLVLLPQQLEQAVMRFKQHRSSIAWNERFAFFPSYLPVLNYTVTH